MYGNDKDIRHNLMLFFIDGILFMPAMTLISITTVIPHFLSEIGASTFQAALAVSMAQICSFVSKPFFGSMASRSKEMHKTFGKVLLTQRLIFLAFVISMPLFAGKGAWLTWTFLFSWGIFNLFAGSYDVFYSSVMIKILPPDKRGSVRGIGNAVGSLLGVGVATAASVVMGKFGLPYNYTLIFFAGGLILVLDAFVFLSLRKNYDGEAQVPMNIAQYVKGMPATFKESAPFRALILTCMLLVVSNGLLTYYTMYAEKVLLATESHVAALMASAVIAGAVGYVCFGALTDRKGPKATLLVVSLLVMAAGGVALLTKSLGFLIVAWVLANLSNCGYMITASLLVGEVSPGDKLPLYMGVLVMISLALSSLVVLLLAPVVERVGFAPVFGTVFACGLLSFLSNRFLMQRRG